VNSSSSTTSAAASGAGDLRHSSSECGSRAAGAMIAFVEHANPVAGLFYGLGGGRRAMNHPVAIAARNGLRVLLGRSANSRPRLRSGVRRHRRSEDQPFDRHGVLIPVQLDSGLHAT